KNKIGQEGIVRKWTKEEMQLRYSKIDYADFKDDLYSWFARLPKEDLNDLIEIFKKINNIDKGPQYIITTPYILSNLDLFLKRYLK
ncbi:MAG: hypothetical protein HC831_02835, partial [Chloroflexia bacterium]|nr:hypothetical protein [Chloroflexia bacterium]